MSTGGSSSETSTVMRAFSLLQLFDVDHPELTLAAMTTRLGYNKATTYRLAQTLVTAGALEQIDENRAYRLGLELVRLGHIASVSSDVRSRAFEGMQRLRDRFGETVYLLVPRDGRSVCVERLEGTRAIRDLSAAPGDSFPMYVGAGGLAMLSVMSPDQQHILLDASSLTRSERTTVDTQLAEAARNGYAVATGDVQRSAGAVAAAVRGHDGTLIGAISLGGPRDEILERHEEMGREVVTAARAASSWHPGQPRA
jgi:DNA-binding IclR family transcriptional regulator